MNDEIIERLIKLEVKLELLTDSIEKYINLQKEHSEIDAKRLDAVEDEIGFWKKLVTRGAASVAFVSTVVGLYLSLRK